MAAIAAREDEIEQSLAGFLRAHAQQEEVMQAARARCEAIMETAAERAGVARGQADTHVVRLVELVKDRDEVATRTGLSQRELRRALRDASARPNEADRGAVRTGGAACTADQAGAEPGRAARDLSASRALGPATATDCGHDDGTDSDGHPGRSDQDTHDAAAVRPSPGPAGHGPAG